MAQGGNMNNNSKFVVIFTDGNELENRYFDSYLEALDLIETEYYEKERAFEANGGVASVDSYVDPEGKAKLVLGTKTFLWEILCFKVSFEIQHY